MKPLTPVSLSARVALGVAFFVVFVALWSAVTLGGHTYVCFVRDHIVTIRACVTRVCVTRP